MFRLQNNVPEIYTKASRDFQLFCHIYDLMTDSVRFSVKSASALLDPYLTNERMLQLLATRVGFFPKQKYNSKVLRTIISMFPYMMKYKGSKKSIEIAVNAVLKAEQKITDVIVRIENNEIVIYMDANIENELLLRDVLSYVIPIGYDLQLQYAKAFDEATTQLGTIDNSSSASYNSQTISVVKNLDDLSSQDSLDSRAEGSYTSEIILGDIPQTGDNNG